MTDYHPPPGSWEIWWKYILAYNPFLLVVWYGTRILSWADWEVYLDPASLVKFFSRKFSVSRVPKLSGKPWKWRLKWLLLFFMSPIIILISSFCDALIFQQFCQDGVGVLLITDFLLRLSCLLPELNHSSLDSLNFCEEVFFFKFSSHDVLQKKKKS